MALMTERIAITRKGMKIVVKLTKNDGSVNVPFPYQSDYDEHSKLLLNKSKKLIERIRSRKIKNRS